MVLRAFRYFVEEALTSLWRSRLINAPLRRHHRGQPVRAGRVPLRGQQPRRRRRALERQGPGHLLPRGPAPGARRARASRPRCAPIPPWSRSRTCRARRRCDAVPQPCSATCASLPDDLGENPFPASLEVTLRPGDAAPPRTRSASWTRSRGRPGSRRCSTTCSGSSAWPPRCASCAGRARSWAAILGAGRRLHDLERDPPDRLRAPGRARHHAPGGRDPRLREGAVRGGGNDPGRAGRSCWPSALLLGGLPTCSRATPLATSDLLGRTAVVLPARPGGAHRGAVGRWWDCAGQSGQPGRPRLAPSRSCRSCPARGSVSFLRLRARDLLLDRLQVLRLAAVEVDGHVLLQLAASSRRAWRA